MPRTPYKCSVCKQPKATACTCQRKRPKQQLAARAALANVFNYSAMPMRETNQELIRQRMPPENAHLMSIDLSIPDGERVDIEVNSYSAAHNRLANATVDSNHPKERLSEVFTHEIVRNASAIDYAQISSRLIKQLEDFVNHTDFSVVLALHNPKLPNKQSMLHLSPSLTTASTTVIEQVQGSLTKLFGTYASLAERLDRKKLVQELRETRSQAEQLKKEKLELQSQIDAFEKKATAF